MRIELVIQAYKVSKANANVKKVKNCKGHNQSIKSDPEIFLVIDNE